MMKSSSIVAAFTILLAVLLLPGMAIANHVIVVDAAGGPGTDYTTLGLAVFNAEDGDTILIRPGFYDNAFISQKSLTLIGDGAERPLLAASSVWLPEPDMRVVLRGLSAVPSVLDSQALNISNCKGSVLVEDCVFEVPGKNMPISTALRVDNSEKVTVTRCSLKGPDGYTSIIGPGIPGSPGLTVQNSNVYLYGCSVTGGAGTDAVLSVPYQFVQDSSAGGPGVSFQGGFIFAAGCEITGGAGGNGLEYSGQGFPSSNGGDGIVVNGNVANLDSVVSGGGAGIDPPGYPQVGVDGVAFDIVGGSVDTIAESYRSYESESPIRNGDHALATITGVPGDLVWLLLSVNPGFIYFPKYRGLLVPEAPLTIIFLGALPPSGTLQFDIPVNVTLPAGPESLLVYEQVIVPGQPYGGVLSAPTAAVIVDSQF